MDKTKRHIGTPENTDIECQQESSQTNWVFHVSRLKYTITLNIVNSSSAEIVREWAQPTMFHMSGVVCQVSGVPCQVSRVTCQVSHVTLSFFFGQNGWARWWRVCYQHGLPRLVSCLMFDNLCTPPIQVATNVVCTNTQGRFWYFFDDLQNNHMCSAYIKELQISDKSQFKCNLS